MCRIQSVKKIYHLLTPKMQDCKKFTCNPGDLGLIPGLGRSPGGGHGNQLQYSYLKNPMDRGAWWAVVHGVTRVGHDLATKLHVTPSHTVLVKVAV